MKILDPTEPVRPKTLGSLVDLDRPAWALAAYSVVGYLVCFWRLGSNRLIQMEGMVADGAGHMVHTGDWLVPRVYGEIYTYKPALAYWLGALTYRIADPPPEWLLRLPFAAAIFAMGLVVLLLVGRLVGFRAASLCAIGSVSTAIVAEKVKLAEFDGLVTTGVGIAIAAACYNLAAHKPKASVWILGYAGLAFGFLAKGVPALMLYPPGALAASWATSRFRRLLDWRHLVAAALFVIVAGGYLFATYRSVGATAFEQPLAESKVRGFGWLWRPSEATGTGTSGTEEFALQGDEAEMASKPLATLLRTLSKPALVFVALLPWSLAVPFASSRRVADSSERQAGLLMRAAGAFLVTGVVVFMAVPTHAMRYYMPLSVPVALLAGMIATQRPSSELRTGHLLPKLSTGLALLVGLLMALAAFAFESPSVSAGERVSMTAVGLLSVLSATWLWRTRAPQVVPATLLLATVCLTVTGTLGVQAVRGAKRDQRVEALALASHVPEGEPVWVLGPSDLAGKNSSILFYLRRPVLAFRPGGTLPPDGAYCLLTSDRMNVFGTARRIRFEPIVTVEYRWRDFLLGRCFRTGLSS